MDINFHETYFGKEAQVFSKSIEASKEQTMTEAEHNRPIPKLFNNRPSASAAEVFGLSREPIIFLNFILNCNPNPPSSPPLED